MKKTYDYCAKPFGMLVLRITNIPIEYKLRPKSALIGAIVYSLANITAWVINFFIFSACFFFVLWGLKIDYVVENSLWVPFAFLVMVAIIKGKGVKVAL